MEALIAKARKRYHQALLGTILTVDKNGVPSNADKASRLSIALARGITNRLLASEQTKSLGQTSGAKFEELNMEFLRETFPKLQGLRPENGKSSNWEITIDSRHRILPSMSISPIFRN